MALLAGLAGIYFIYAAALTAGLQFDDRANLNGLRQVADGRSLLQFVFSGNAGPLGRPLSLLSFGLQGASWPAHPEDFIYVNILIHLLNGCLVAWLALLLSEQIFGRRQLYPALLTAAIWLAMPLLASSSLMIIQRMATLAGTMTLLGLLVFVKIRLAPALRDWARVLLCGLVLIVFTGLAASAKENGALFPVQCLAIEILISHNAANRLKKWAAMAWRGLFLYVPVLLIVIYLLSRLPYAEGTIVARGFDGTSRLLFEAKALIVYLLHGFVPRANTIGPFHDQMIVDGGLSFYVSTCLAVVFWVVLGWILFRKRAVYPELVFGYIWYLGSHLLESSTVALELYFEHRNYIPMVGVVMALVFFSFRFRKTIGERLYYPLSLGYALLMAVVLYGQTTLWGNPFMSAVMWSHHNPASPRAMLNLVAIYQDGGSYDAALKTLDKYYQENGDLRARFMRLIVLCEKGAPIAVDDRLMDFSVPAKYKTGYALWMSAAFERLYITEQVKKCEGLGGGEIYSLGVDVLKSQEVGYSHISKHNINSILAAMAINAGKFDEAKPRLMDALNASFHLDTFDVAMRVAKHTDDGELEAYLWGKVYEARPRDVMKRQTWDQKMKELEKIHPRANHD